MRAVVTAVVTHRCARVEAHCTVTVTLVNAKRRFRRAFVVVSENPGSRQRKSFTPRTRPAAACGVTATPRYCVLDRWNRCSHPSRRLRSHVVAWSVGR